MRKHFPIRGLGGIPAAEAGRGGGKRDRGPPAGRHGAAAEMCNVKTILVSGGVAGNRELRQKFEAETRHRGMSVFFPSRELSTDNAAMIAAAAFARYSIGEQAGSDLNAMPNMPLGASS